MRKVEIRVRHTEILGIASLSIYAVSRWKVETEGTKVEVVRWRGKGVDEKLIWGTVIERILFAKVFSKSREYPRE